MAKSGALYTLVHSLTKSEKRYFKLMSGLQGGDKDYLTLFSLLEKSPDHASAQTVFSAGRNKGAFQATAKYLYKVLTDCLLQVRLDGAGHHAIVMRLMKAEILFEKSMYNESLAELRKCYQLAAKQELYHLQLWSLQLELNYLDYLNYTGVTERELVKKQIAVSELLKYARTARRHRELYELLKYRLLNRGPARTVAQKEMLNDLVITELNLMSGASANTFESLKTHLLFQANYFMSVNDHVPALKTFRELAVLFDRHQSAWRENPFDYIAMLEGILDSLHSIGKFADMVFFVERLNKINHSDGWLNLITQKIVYVYTIVRLLNTGYPEEASAQREYFSEKLFRRLHLLDLNKQAEVYLYSAIVQLTLGKISKAHMYLRKILVESRVYHAFPVFRTFRLIHLLVHYELGNHDYIVSETRSLKRELRTNSRGAYQVEKLVFKFVLDDKPVSGRMAKEQQWKKYRAEFAKINTGKYDRQVMKYFDFEGWIHSRIFRTAFPVRL